MSTIVSEIHATAIEPEYVTLNVERDDDGNFRGGNLNLELANIIMTDGNGSRFTSVCEVNIALMASDLEELAGSLLSKPKGA